MDSQYIRVNTSVQHDLPWEFGKEICFLTQFTLMALNQREAIKKKVESPNLQAIVEKVHTQMKMHNFFDFGST